MCNDVQRRVKEFVAKTASVRVGRMHSGTTLFGDLGIDGDDAHEFFVAFRDHFDVDVSSLDLSKHFGPEGMPLWAPIMWLSVFFFKEGSDEEKANLRPIRISDLCQAVVLGHWDPEIQGREENALSRVSYFQFSLRTMFAIMGGVCMSAMLISCGTLVEDGRWNNYRPGGWTLFGCAVMTMSIKKAGRDESAFSAWCWFVAGWLIIIAFMAWTTQNISVDTPGGRFAADLMKPIFHHFLVIDLWLPLFLSALAANVFVQKRHMLGHRAAVMIGCSLLIAGIDLIVLWILYSNLLTAVHHSQVLHSYNGLIP